MPRALAIINGDDIHHDLLTASQVFQDLGAAAGFATTRAMGLRRFVDPRPATADSTVYVLYTAGGEFPERQQRALAELVAGGKGMVVIHASNVLGSVDGQLEPGDRAMYELLGNRYLSHGPGHHEGRFRVEIVGRHPIVDGLDDFDLFDEFYEYELADDNIEVLAQRRRADGAVIPVLYTRLYGDGRVCYLALGHDMRAWGEPAFRTIVRRAIAWAGKLGEGAAWHQE